MNIYIHTHMPFFLTVNELSRKSIGSWFLMVCLFLQLLISVLTCEPLSVVTCWIHSPEERCHLGAMLRAEGRRSECSGVRGGDVRNLHHLHSLCLHRTKMTIQIKKLFFLKFKSKVMPRWCLFVTQSTCE